MIWECALNHLTENIKTVSKNIDTNMERKQFFEKLILEMENIYKTDQGKENNESFRFNSVHY